MDASSLERIKAVERKGLRFEEEEGQDREKVRQMLKDQEDEDRKDDDPPSSGGTREKQIEKLTKQAERIEAWL